MEIANGWKCVCPKLEYKINIIPCQSSQISAGEQSLYLCSVQITQLKTESLFNYIFFPEKAIGAK